MRRKGECASRASVKAKSWSSWFHFPDWQRIPRHVVIFVMISSLCHTRKYASVLALIPPSQNLRSHQSLHQHCHQHPRHQRSSLYYNYYFQEDDESDPSSSQQQPGPGRQPALPKVLTTPVFSPIPGRAPLLVGEEFWLNHPTPLQWSTIEECLNNHHQYLQELEQRESAGTKTAGISAAPIIAFMDEWTSRAPISEDKYNAKYATIAAIVGIKNSASSSKELESTEKIDTSSSTSFMESMARITSSSSGENMMLRPYESRIRLLGVGRAALWSFHSRLPSSHYDKEDDQHDSLKSEAATTGNDEDDDDDDDELEQAAPILLAQFRLLVDTNERSSKFTTNTGRSRLASPVHALAELSSLTAKLVRLHEDRQRLVRGLKAAQARLAVAASNDDLEDHDGLGLLSSGFSDMEDTSQEEESPQQQDAIDTMLHDFPGGSTSNHDVRQTSDKPSSHVEQLHELDNYGMGFSAAAFSALPSLTDNLMGKLAPYYSPQRQSSEQHYYELLSFVAVLSLHKYLRKASDLDWALKSTNTMERMQWAYEWMWSHKQLLLDASQQLSEELRNCGEECTDLW